MKCGGTSDCIYRFQPISPVFEALLVTYTKRGQLLVRLRVDKRRVIQEYKLKLLPGALHPKIDSLD
jgi:hypothetical protein